MPLRNIDVVLSTQPTRPLRDCQSGDVQFDWVTVPWAVGTNCFLLVNPSSGCHMADSSQSEGKPRGGSLSARRHPKITLQGEGGLGGGFQAIYDAGRRTEPPEAERRTPSDAEGSFPGSRRREGVVESLLNTFTIFFVKFD